MGLTGNVHFYEMLDWLLGWFTYDISHDDLATYYAMRERAEKELAASQPADEPPAPPPQPPRKPTPPKPHHRRPSAGRHSLEELVP